MYISRLFFFFSSRRRHTRYWRDWSSDVCSSDLSRCSFRARRAVRSAGSSSRRSVRGGSRCGSHPWPRSCSSSRSEEHTSELQSRQYLVCRLLLEKKKYKDIKLI